MDNKSPFTTQGPVETQSATIIDWFKWQRVSELSKSSHSYAKHHALSSIIAIL
jgi:hypothetical protein